MSGFMLGSSSFIRFRRFSYTIKRDQETSAPFEKKNLPQMTLPALRHLSSSPKGFFTIMGSLV